MFTRTIGIAALLASSVAVAAQNAQPVDDAKLPRFEVASVTPGDPNAYYRSIGSPPGRFFTHDMELSNVVTFAFYGQDQDGYALTLARSDGRLGPGLRRSPVDCASRLAALRAKQEVPPLPAGAAECGIRNGRGVIDAGGIPIATVVRMLGNQTLGPVVDETGLTGPFDVMLRFSPASAGALRADAPAPDDAPSIFTAVQEQLGLKLLPRKVTIQRVVIEHIEQPEPD